MRIRRREVVEEEIAICQKVIGDLEQLEQVCGREFLDALFSAGNVADPRRGVDARQEGMNAARAPRHQRDRLQLLPGIVRQQSCVREGARNPGLDCDTLAQDLSIDDEERHLVLWIDLQVLGRGMLARFEIERMDPKFRTGFSKGDVGRERTGDWSVVKGDFHDASDGHSWRLGRASALPPAAMILREAGSRLFGDYITDMSFATFKC